MEEMSVNHQMFHAKIAAYMLRQNGTVISDRCADAIDQLVETMQSMQIQMSEMEIKKS